MKTEKSLATLIAQLDADAKELARIGKQNERAWERIKNGADDPIDWGALGFTLHHLYGVLENYFTRISKYFENTPAADKWHKELIERMRLDIPGVRPALLADDSDYRNALQLMRFRHRFRNLYGEDLDPARTSEVQNKAHQLLGRFPVIHREFCEKISTIAEGLP